MLVQHSLRTLATDCLRIFNSTELVIRTWYKPDVSKSINAVGTNFYGRALMGTGLVKYLQIGYDLQKKQLTNPTLKNQILEQILYTYRNLTLFFVMHPPF